VRGPFARQAEGGYGSGFPSIRIAGECLRQNGTVVTIPKNSLTTGHWGHYLPVQRVRGRFVFREPYPRCKPGSARRIEICYGIGINVE